MLTKEEKQIVVCRSEIWKGPNAWGFFKGYRISLPEVLDRSQYG
jgi:hypothetical protein